GRVGPGIKYRLTHHREPAMTNRRSILVAIVALSLMVLTVPARSAPKPPAAPEKLTWNDLVNHPERWPATCKVNVPLKFSGGATLKPGTEVKINAVTARGAQLIAPQGFAFDVAAKDCDLLDAANAAWAKLTPEQRNLTVAAIVADKSLWPAKVTLTQ